MTEAMRNRIAFREARHTDLQEANSRYLQRARQAEAEADQARAKVDDLLALMDGMAPAKQAGDVLDDVVAALEPFEQRTQDGAPDDSEPHPQNGKDRTAWTTWVDRGARLTPTSGPALAEIERLIEVYGDAVEQLGRDMARKGPVLADARYVDVAHSALLTAIHQLASAQPVADQDPTPARNEGEA